MRPRFGWLCASFLGVLLPSLAQAEEPIPVKVEPTFYTPKALQEQDGPVRSRFTARQDVGDGVGYRDGFSYLEAFLPVGQTCDSVLFANARIINYNHSVSDWELQGGTGYRRYLPSINRIAGVNTFWDWRDTPYSDYHQVGLGIELLGERLDFRANGYLILGRDQAPISDNLVGPFPQGANNLFVRVRGEELALTGFNAEVGTPLPFIERFDVRAFAGYYYYQNEAISNVNGIRGRLEAKWGDRVTAHFIVSHDDRFQTSVTGGLAIHFGGGSSRCRSDVRSRLGERVVRDPNIVIDQNRVSTPQFVPVPPPPPPPVVVRPTD